ncbi:MAG: ATP-binding protein [Flavobacteriales bacterium]|nr:ATP-binding protein [Flavobacteriales bacterium]
MLVDRKLVTMALTNIAVNAIEAMEPGEGVLQLSARSTFDGVVIAVRDNGRASLRRTSPAL